MEISWTDFKSISVAKFLPIQWVEDEYFYYLTIIDGNLKFKCEIDKNPTDSADLEDFEDNFKASSNKSFSDTDGIPFFRVKAAKRGWRFWALPIEISTSTLNGSLFAKTADDSDVPGLVCKIYNANNEEITTPGLLNANLATCTKTVLDFEPNFDYEMIGGILRVNTAINQDVRLWVVGAPDIPVNLGGSKEFASGVNLKFLAPDNAFEIDGRVTKYVSYNPNTHQGKLRVIIKHPAGLSVNLQVIIHTFKL